MMIRFYHAALLIASSTLIACGSQTPPPPKSAGSSAPRELLGHLVERYWDENAALRPWYSWGGAEIRFGEAPADTIAPQALADSLAMERRYLAEVLGIPRATAADPVTYDMFVRERQLAIESFTYPSELLPVNPYDSMPQQFALMAAAAERQAVSSGQDLNNWQIRSESFVRWTDQAIVNLRDGMSRGYTLPRILVEKTLPELAALGDDTQGNVFYLALGAQAGDGTERARLAPALAATVREKILPAYRLLHDFLQKEYLPHSRDSVGLAALPLGTSWYAYLIKRSTGNARAPEELHAFGLAEVDRLHARMRALLADTPFAGNAQGFYDSLRADPRHSYTSTDELLSGSQALKVEVAAAVPTLFPMPHADFEIRAAEGFRAPASAPFFYRRSTAFGKNPAVLYVAADAARPSGPIAPQFLREAIPGHHTQLALQQERTDLPRFRRFGGVPAFIEGWGLYAASLGEELGIYRDTEAKFGALLAQLDCAAGAVIDTGLHAQGWTRQQALDYLHAHVPLDDAAAANAVDRSIALPAEALACVTGFVKMQALRTHAQQVLGARFDSRAFHTEVLKDGAMPLDLLEARINQWMETTAKLD